MRKLLTLVLHNSKKVLLMALIAGLMSGGSSAVLISITNHMLTDQQQSRQTGM